MRLVDAPRHEALGSEQGKKMLKQAIEFVLRNSKGILPSSPSSIRCMLRKDLCTRTHTEAARERAECVVIGAGVVGLAVARELTLRGREVLVLDSAPTFGTGTSSRNSQVIHAGIYYRPHSLKVPSLLSFSLLAPTIQAQTLSTGILNFG
jgi:hypothetical protein